MDLNRRLCFSIIEQYKINPVIPFEDESTDPEVHRVVLCKMKSTENHIDESTDPEVHRVSIV